MPEWLDRLTESKEDKKARMFEEFSASAEFKDMLKHQASELLKESRELADAAIVEEEEAVKQRLIDAEESISTVSADMEESTKPFVLIRSIDFTPERGIEIKLDFNPAFIKYLKTNGVEGKNDDETVRRWLAYLSHDILQQSIAEDYVVNGVPDDELPDGRLEDMLEEIQREQNDDEDESDTGW